jgi:FtsZ-binding cell division protein ZapB
MSKKTISTFILSAIGIIGGVLVSEQVISGETLASIQGYAGMALAGGTISIGMIIGAINLIPTSTAQNIVDKIGAEKVNKVFDTVEVVVNEVSQLKDIIVQLQTELQLEREARNELGVYDSLSQDTKDKLNV